MQQTVINVDDLKSRKKSVTENELKIKVIHASSCYFAWPSHHCVHDWVDSVPKKCCFSLKKWDATNEEFSCHNWVTYLIIHQAYIMPNVSRENSRAQKSGPSSNNYNKISKFGKENSMFHPVTKNNTTHNKVTNHHLIPFKLKNISIISLWESSQDDHIIFEWFSEWSSYQETGWHLS